MCETLSVYVDPRLHSLCKRTMPEINFVKDMDELKEVDSDYHLPLGSVPGVTRNDISDFDRTVTGYLKTNPYGKEKKGSALLCGENRVLVMISFF